MKTFKDTKETTWTISITLGSASRVLSECKVDLLSPEAGEPPLITRLSTDEYLLGDVIACLLGDQIITNNCTDKAGVLERFDGATMLLAHKAFWEELTDFFRQRGRADRVTALEKQTLMVQAAIEAASKRIAAIDTQKVIDGLTSGPLPELSESTPQT